MIRNSALDQSTEENVSILIDCGVTIHRVLGPGFVEPVYRNAFCLELECRHIPFECEKQIVVKYRDAPVGLHKIDLIVHRSIIVELKAVSSIEPVHVAQVLSYLKATGLRVGLLMNFSGATLRDGLRRIIR